LLLEESSISGPESPEDEDSPENESPFEDEDASDDEEPLEDEDLPDDDESPKFSLSISEQPKITAPANTSENKIAFIHASVYKYSK
jgi:hypothetical protein